MAKSQTKFFEEAFEPLVEFSNLSVKTAETAFKMQMDSLQTYAKIGMDNVSEGLKVRNVDDMIAYAEKQKDLAKKTSDMFISDAKALADLNVKYLDNARSMIESNVKNSVAAATKATKAA